MTCHPKKKARPLGSLPNSSLNLYGRSYHMCVKDNEAGMEEKDLPSKLHLSLQFQQCMDDVHRIKLALMPLELQVELLMISQLKPLLKPQPMEGMELECPMNYLFHYINKKLNPSHLIREDVRNYMQTWVCTLYVQTNKLKPPQAFIFHNVIS